MLVRINLKGCDDSTCFDIEMTQEQFNFLRSIAEKSKEVSEYVCMPTMELKIK